MNESRDESKPSSAPVSTSDDDDVAINDDDNNDQLLKNVEPEAKPSTVLYYGQPTVSKYNVSGSLSSGTKNSLLEESHHDVDNSDSSAFIGSSTSEYLLPSSSTSRVVSFGSVIPILGGDAIPSSGRNENHLHRRLDQDVWKKTVLPDTITSNSNPRAPEEQRPHQHARATSINVITTTSTTAIAKPGKIRRSSSTDMDTGIKGGRECVARSVEISNSTTPNEKRHQMMMLQKMLRQTNTDSVAGSIMQSQRHGRLEVTTPETGCPLQSTVYRLEAIQPPVRGPKLLRWLGLGQHISIYEEAEQHPSSFSTGTNTLVMAYLHWSFRSSFTAAFLSAVLVYFIQIFFFALLIWIVTMNKPTCIGAIDPSAYYFTDAFALSWQTFTTTGMGVPHTALSSEVDDIRSCTGVTIVVCLEAFVGMLYASMVTAIMFAKMSRVQSFAKVIFSDPVVIRYGKGVAIEYCHDAGIEECVSGEEEPPIPCPILEFRINNTMHSIRCGEIVDATINIAASVDAVQVCPRARPISHRRRKGRRKQKSAPIGHTPSWDIASSWKRSSSVHSVDSHHDEHKTSINNPVTISFTEDPTGRIVPKRVFAKLDLESPDHPYFKRVWVVRHKLDQDSPLLREAAREWLKRSNGHWPRELNNHEGVRSSIHFDQILISLSGTSNADANPVYAQKVYSYKDLVVGYGFANQLYRDLEDESLQVDTRLISDVVEQHGGGGEPLTNHHRRQSLWDVLIL